MTDTQHDQQDRLEELLRQTLRAKAERASSAAADNLAFLDRRRPVWDRAATLCAAAAIILIVTVLAWTREANQQVEIAESGQSSTVLTESVPDREMHATTSAGTETTANGRVDGGKVDAVGAIAMAPPFGPESGDPLDYLPRLNLGSGMEFDVESEAVNIKFVQSVRSNAGVPTLVTNGILTDIAREIAISLASKDPRTYFSIESSWGSNLGFDTVASAKASGLTVTEVNASLEASRPDVATIARPEWTYIGVGAVRYQGRIFILQIFATGSSELNRDPTPLDSNETSVAAITTSPPPPATEPDATGSPRPGTSIPAPLGGSEASVAATTPDSLPPVTQPDNLGSAEPGSSRPG